MPVTISPYADSARDDVERPARRGGHDEADRLVGIVLLRPGGHGDHPGSSAQSAEGSEPPRSEEHTSELQSQR